MESVEAIQHVNIIRHLLRDDGTFPNNALLPLLVYQKVLQLPGDQNSRIVKVLFETNGWTNAWENGVYNYHHYHSTAHEVLGVIKGSVRIQFGGPAGIAQLLDTGDAVVIPAGVAHKAIDVYDDFTCVGAYPAGQDYDIKRGEKDERAEAIRNIKALALPATDPLYGPDGPLLTNWKL